MSILKKSFLLYVLCLFLLQGCEQIIYTLDGKSENRHRIEALPKDNWIEFAQTLSVEERLALHSELWLYSGHPPETILQDAFDAQPKETYNLIIRRINNGQADRSIFGLLITIERNNNFSICDQPNHKTIQKFMKSNYPDYYEGIKNTFEFVTC